MCVRRRTRELRPRPSGRFTAWRRSGAPPRDRCTDVSLRSRTSLTCQSPQSPLPLAGERTAGEHNKITLGHTEVLYEPPNEAQIRLRVRGRPACAEFCPSTHCCPPNSYYCAKRTHRDQRSDRLQPLVRERERGGPFSSVFEKRSGCGSRPRVTQVQTIRAQEMYTALKTHKYEREARAAALEDHKSFFAGLLGRADSNARAVNPATDPSLAKAAVAARRS